MASGSHTCNENTTDQELDFSGHFDVRKLNEHLRLCLRQNNNKDVVDSQCQYTGEMDSPKTNDVDVIMDEYIQIFLQLYK